MRRHDGIPLSRRDQERPDESLSAAVGRLRERCDQLQNLLTACSRERERLRLELEWARQREQRLHQRIEALLKRDRPRRRAPDQLSLPLG